MAGEQQHQRRSPSEVEEEHEPAPQARERREALDQDVDAILDEIDDVLEQNAEEFVRGFVQKGGQ